MYLSVVPADSKIDAVACTAYMSLEAQRLLFTENKPISKAGKKYA